ncbi:MAG: sugar phosphate isomerase/epimerase [Spirochaetales bacterium]|jgi:sugar phosphate isomerase/epimerase
MREHIGINADSFTINGDIAVLEKFLARFLEAGFFFAEIPIHGMDCLLNGSLCRSRVAATRKALSAYPLGYTVHSPDHLNLADETDPETHARALRSTIDFASEIGARLVVYHGSARAGGRADAASTAMAEMPISPPPPTELRAFWADEIDRLGAVADYAAARGVTVAVENIFRQSAREVTYRIDPRQLAAVVAAVDSPALGICFDFGHAFISAGEVGFTMEEALRAVKPRLAHVHIHDNFGKPSIPNARPIDMMFRGAGDLHMPPGWGAIPYESLFPIFAGDFRGVFTLELQPRFSDKYGEALEWVKHRIASAKGAP